MGKYTEWVITSIFDTPGMKNSHFCRKKFKKKKNKIRKQKSMSLIHIGHLFIG